MGGRLRHERLWIHYRMKIRLGLSNSVRPGSLGVSRGSGALVDSTRPTVTITCSQTNPTVTTPLNLTFTFSESVTGFTVGDIVGGGSSGTLSGFAGSGSIYTADITPSSAGILTVDVPAGVCQDSAGNTNLAATQFTITTIVYLLQDLFTTNQAAPLTSPRTCEPGPGTLSILDTTNKLFIAGNQLTWMTGSSEGNPMALTVTGVFTRSLGLCITGKLNGNENGRIKFSPTTSIAANSAHDHVYWSGVSLRVGAGTPIVRGANTGINPVYLMCRTNGYFIVQDVSGTKSLLWVFGGTTQPLGTKLFGMTGPTSGASGTVDNLYVAQLPAPYNTDTGLASSISASPPSGTQLSHPADGGAEVVWMAATGTTCELWVRMTDASNGWIIRASQPGSTIKIIEKNAGVETERASSAITLTAGTSYRFYAVFFSNQIWVNANALNVNDATLINYQSASFNNTATLAMVAVNIGALSNFITWPRTLSGTALTVLQTAFP